MSNSSISNFKYLGAAVGTVAIALAAYVAVILASVGAAPLAGDQFWTAYFVRQKEALAGEAKGKRILLFGSSSTFFGVRAADIQNVTGVPTINLATHGSNGIAFMLRQAEAVAREGDIVILLPDFSTMVSDQYITRHGAIVSYSLHGRLLKHGPILDRVKSVAEINLAEIRTAAEHNSWKPRIGGYWSLRFDKNGDLFAPEYDPAAFGRSVKQASTLPSDYPAHLLRVRKNKAKTEYYSIPGLILGSDVAPIPRQVVQAVAETRNGLENRGVRVFLATPPSIYTPRAAMIDAFYAMAGGADNVLGNPAASTIPEELTYDTVFHASPMGATYMTSVLTVALCDAAAREKFAHCSAADIDKAQKNVTGIKAINPMALRKNVGPQEGPYPDSKLPIVRWLYGPVTSFEVYAPQNCRNRLEIEGMATAETGAIRISMDGKGLLERVQKPGAFDTLSIDLPKDGDAHAIEIHFDGGNPSGKNLLSLLVRRMQRHSECD